jgi:hypothetical protein
MNTNQTFTDSLSRSFEMLKMTLADLSDADLLVRPAPGANHGAWQLGHLATSEARIVAAARGGAAPELPAGFADRFKKDAARSDDAAAFPKKQELLDTFAKVRAASVEWARTLTPEQMDQDSPESIRAFCPKVGHVPGMLVEHAAMHLGQFQVLRRKLGKPVLF